MTFDRRTKVHPDRELISSAVRGAAGLRYFASACGSRLGEYELRAIRREERGGLLAPALCQLLNSASPVRPCREHAARRLKDDELSVRAPHGKGSNTVLRYAGHKVSLPVVDPQVSNRGLTDHVRQSCAIRRQPGVTVNVGLEA